MKDKKLLSFGDDEDQDGEDGATFSSKYAHFINFILGLCNFSTPCEHSWCVLVCNERAVNLILLLYFLFCVQSK